MSKNGFQGMSGNMNNLMKQAQKLQKQMEDTQKELESKEFKSSVGGGAVVVTITGKKVITNISIKPEIIDENDVELLEDLVLTAVNEALKKAEEEAGKSMGKLTSALNIPGGL